MSTSIKISQRDKEKLDKLQALITLESGEKVSQQDLMSALLEMAFTRKEEITKRLSEVRIPLTDEEYQRILEYITDWGIETKSEDIDKYLYGKARKR